MEIFGKGYPKLPTFSSITKEGEMGVKHKILKSVIR